MLVKCKVSYIIEGNNIECMVQCLLCFTHHNISTQQYQVRLLSITANVEDFTIPNILILNSNKWVLVVVQTTHAFLPVTKSEMQFL